MTHGFGGFLSPGGLAGAEAAVVAVGQVMVLALNASFSVFPSICKSKY